MESDKKSSKEGTFANHLEEMHSKWYKMWQKISLKASVNESFQIKSYTNEWFKKVTYNWKKRLHWKNLMWIAFFAFQNFKNPESWIIQCSTVKIYMFIIKKRYKEGKKKVTKRMNMSSINQYKIDAILTAWLSDSLTLWLLDSLTPWLPDSLTPWLLT